MKYGFVLPSGDARAAADLAVELERAGWDALFVWEPVWGVDAWVSLTAAAMVTERLRLGTMITPPSRMRPWKLASEAATLDNLSGGRVTLTVGLGAPEVGFAAFGEEVRRKERAELLDEALDIVTGLWRGAPFTHEGKHYTVRVPGDFVHQPPRPRQQPRIPLWVVAAWPFEKSMARAIKYDGIVPSSRGEDGNIRQATADEVREIAAWAAERGRSDIDIVVEGETPDAGAIDRLPRAYEAAGATWYIEAMWSATSHDAVLGRARRGPPRVD